MQGYFPLCTVAIRPHILTSLYPVLFLFLFLFLFRGLRHLRNLRITMGFHCVLCASSDQFTT